MKPSYLFQMVLESFGASILLGLLKFWDGHFKLLHIFLC